MAHQLLSGDIPGDQRNHDIQPDREQQGFPGHRDIGDPQKQGDNRCEGENHDDVVYGYLDQRVGRIAPRHLRPDKHHCGTGSGAQQDEPADIFLSIFRRDEIGEQDFEKQHAESCHRERLDQPVYREGNDEAFGPVADVADTGEVDIHHHRIHHRPDQKGDDEVHRCVFPACNHLEGARCDIAEDQARGNTQRNPDREPFFKETDSAGGFGVCHVVRPCFDWIEGCSGGQAVKRVHPRRKSDAD